MFQEMIKEIADELNIKFTLFSKDWCILLEKGEKSRIISGFKFDLNHQGPSLVADDKYALYELLSLKNIPIIEHKILYSDKNKNYYAMNSKGIAKALSYFRSKDDNIVLKPNDGTSGIDIYHVTSEEELIDAYNKLFPKYFSISMCPYYRIKNEYRTIMLDGEVELFYQKERPIIIGDGFKTIKELLLEFNHGYYENEENIPEIDLSVVPKKGELVEIGWQFNLSRGSRVNIDIDSNLKNKIVSLAKKAYNASNLRFCSVDIIETFDNEFLIMEINSGVVIKKFVDLVPNGYEIAKKVYKDAIIKMFE